MHTLGIRLSWSTGGECGNCAHRLPFSADFPCKPRRVSRLEGWNAARCSFVTPGMPVQSAENELTCPRMLGEGRVCGRVDLARVGGGTSAPWMIWKMLSRCFPGAGSQQGNAVSNHTELEVC